jgi:hypothetical protein
VPDRGGVTVIGPSRTALRGRLAALRAST